MVQPITSSNQEKYVYSWPTSFILFQCPLTQIVRHHKAISGHSAWEDSLIKEFLLLWCALCQNISKLLALEFLGFGV